MPATIFAGPKVKALKSTLSLNGGADVISSTTDPTSVAVSADPGSLLLNTTSGKLYRKNDSGSSTNWSEVGSGGSGINYVTNPTAATNTTGWSTYADAAGTQPVDGTGGSPTVTWTRSTTTPLRGAGDFNFTKDAANRQGEGVATDITIDLADQAKVLTVSFDYEVLSGTYATGDLTVYLIADPSGTPIVIQPAGYQIQSGTAGTKMRQVATFQTQATGQSYRVCFHVASVSALAYALAIDNVVVGPQTVQYGAPVTDWQLMSHTWASTGGGLSGGTTPVDLAYSRRVGDSLEVTASLVAGGAGISSGVGDYYFQLPSQYTLDVSKISANETSLGDAVILNNGVTRQNGSVMYRSSNSVYVIITTGGGSGLVGQNVPAAGWFSSAGDTISVNFRVPILGWSSTVQMSNDTDTRVVAFSGYTAATTAFSGVITKVAMTSVADSHAGWSTDTYTVPVSGYYKIVASLPVYSPATTGNGFARIYIDSTAVNTTYQAIGIVGGTSLLALDWEQFLTAGQQISVRINNSSGSMSLLGSVVGAVATLTINRLSGPSAIAATETVAASYYTTSGQSIPASALTKVIWNTKYYDTHGGMNTSTGIYTVPVSGKYRITGMVEFNGGANVSFRALDQDGAAYAGMASKDAVPIGVAARVSGSFEFNYLAGQTIALSAFQNSSGSITLTTSQAYNWITICRVGN